MEELIDYGLEQMGLLYRRGKEALPEHSRGRALMEYKFRFYREHAALVLAFHRAKVSTSLLDIITDCEIESFGDMPASSISRYELYFHAGAFYNMLLCWLESGARESPEAMADLFQRLTGQP